MVEDHTSSSQKNVKTSELFKTILIGSIITALAILVALAWNSAISATINAIYKIPADSARGKVIYACIITIIVAIILYLLVITHQVGAGIGQTVVSSEQGV